MEYVDRISCITIIIILLLLFRFVFFVVAGNPLPFLPWCWCRQSGPVFFLLGRTKTRFGVCCCCCCTCIDIYRNRKSIFVVVGTGIDMFEIGLSLILCLRLHLLLYYKVQQQIEMDKLVSNIHPVSRSNRSYYNHHHCCCCSDLFSLLLLLICSKSDYHWSFVSVSISSCIIKSNSKSKWTNLFRIYIL